MSEYSKPLPKTSGVAAPFWAAAKRHELVVQTCNGCGVAQYPPRDACHACWSEDLGWRTSEGRGTVHTYTVVRRSSVDGFQDETPYVVALVELAEGPRMTTNIVDCPVEAVRIGMSVAPVFDDATDEITLVKFRPA